MDKLRMLISLTILFLVIDFYVFTGVQFLVSHLTSKSRNIVYYLYWFFSFVTLSAWWFYHLSRPYEFNRFLAMIMQMGILINYFPKIFALLFLLIADLSKFLEWSLRKVIALFVKESTEVVVGRSEFLVKSAFAVSTVPLVGISYGIISGAHDYRVRHQKVVLPNLPSSFHGLKILQLSDIHSGSFFNKTAVIGGVEMAMREKPDLVFFTGDLVNNFADEVKEYISIFSKIKAPLGVYSVLGNHDYGDYSSWVSAEAKKNNLERLKAAHALMGWRLMMNEHEFLTQGADKLAIIGVENYGVKARFPKYGKLDIAHKNTNEAAVKLLLSHDPSHWDAQVNTQFKDIDLMFAGHTHGFQFGVEIGSFQWSPVQYMYEQWGGLYTKGNQHLYVNRGFGYLGFTGRVGMPPEITVIELIKG